MPLPDFFEYYSFVILFKIRESDMSSFVLLSQDSSNLDSQFDAPLTWGRVSVVSRKPFLLPSKAACLGLCDAGHCFGLISVIRNFLSDVLSMNIS